MLAAPITSLLIDIYRHLRDHFGHRKWWPGDTPFEVMVGAVLTQNTAWANVEKAVANLKREGVLTAHAVRRIPEQRLAGLIRPSGYYNQKTARLISLTDWFLHRCGGHVGKLSEVETKVLREELLSLNGIGPETADSILLYAFERPVFVIDAYTRRALERIGVWQGGAYDDLQRLFMDNMPGDVKLFNDYHAQFVALGKDYCRSRNPFCASCPLLLLCRFGQQHTGDTHAPE